MPGPAGASEKFNAADWLVDRHLREGRGERVAVAGVDRKLTYEELAEGVNRFGSALRDLGIEPGDRVLLVLPDSPEFLFCFLGTVKVGAVAVPVNPLARPADFSHYASDSGAKLAVVHFESSQKAAEGFRKSTNPPRVLSAGPEARQEEALETLLTQSSAACEPQLTRADDIAFFLYTSGSGGTPKAALHRHGHMRVTSQCFAKHVLAIRPEDVTFSVSKLFFAYGLGNGLTFPLSVGAATVLLPAKPSPEIVFATLRKHRPALFFSVPTIYGLLLQSGGGTKEDFESVRLAVSAGEALPAEIFQRFREKFGLEIVDGIGTTEMLHIFISNWPGRAKAGCTGAVVPGYRARVADEDGEDSSEGEIGNLWVKGESAFAGYWNQPALTASAKQDDWVVTGDKFYRDKDGDYYYCGRSDDMLKVSGLWVSPLEVENALLSHTAVNEAAVVGRKTSDGLTRIVSFVVLAQGVEGTQDMDSALKEHVSNLLPRYKCPESIEFVDGLPKTATGKIQRYKLRE